MDPKDLRLFDLLRIDDAQGTISLHGQRMIVVNAGDLGLLRKELITTFGTDRARGILIRFGYARGYRDALATKEMFGWKSVDDWLSAGARLYTIEGSGAIEIVRAINSFPVPVSPDIMEHFCSNHTRLCCPCASIVALIVDNGAVSQGKF